MPKSKKTSIPKLTEKSDPESPPWEEIGEDLVEEFRKEADKNPRIAKELKQKEGNLKRRTITQIVYKFMQKKQKEGRLEKTAWKKGGISLYKHGLIAGANAGRLNDLVAKTFDGKGTVRFYQFVELRQKGIIPQRNLTRGAYESIKNGKITQPTALKIAQGLGYKEYIHPYTTKGGRKITGYFRNKIKP